MKGPWNLLSRGPPNQIKISPQPLDSYLCMSFCLMSLGIVQVHYQQLGVYRFEKQPDRCRPSTTASIYKFGTTAIGQYSSCTGSSSAASTTAPTSGLAHQLKVYSLV
jgi:hypothetical protein